MNNAFKLIVILVLITSIISVSAFANEAEPGSVTVLGITALAPMMTSPLAKMDLIPVPAPMPTPVPAGQIHSFGYSVPDLSPRSVVAKYTPPLHRPRFSKFLAQRHAFHRVTHIYGRLERGRLFFHARSPQAARPPGREPPYERHRQEPGRIRRR